jgi:hypothetical protein
MKDMKRRITFCCGLVAVIGIGYLAGVFHESLRSSEQAMSERMHHWDQLADLDRTFLKTISAATNNLTSGNYLLEFWFPHHKPRVEELTLQIQDGKIIFPAPKSPGRAGIAETFSMAGNVVSWLDEGALYEADAKFVGIITGTEIYGRVYGWNSGDESIGWWRIYPKTSREP